MKSKSIAYKLTGLFMIAGAACAFVMAVIIFISRLSAPGSTITMSIISGLLTIIWALIDLKAAVISIFGTKKDKQLKKVLTFGIISIILFLIQSLLSAANGIAIIHLLILFVCGFVIPCLHLYMCRLKM